MVYIHIYKYIYIYIYVLWYNQSLLVIYFQIHFISSSSSSCHAASTDIPDPLSPRLPIIHRLRQVFRDTSRIIT